MKAGVWIPAPRSESGTSFAGMTWVGTRKRSKGVALLQALILVNIIALTAAAMMIVVMSGFMGTVQVEKSIDYRGAAEAALAMAMQDLECRDPNTDGTVSAAEIAICPAGPSGCAVSTPPSSCTYTVPVSGKVATSVSVTVNFTYDAGSGNYTVATAGFDFD